MHILDLLEDECAKLASVQNASNGIINVQHEDGKADQVCNFHAVSVFNYISAVQKGRRREL